MPSVYIATGYKNRDAYAKARALAHRYGLGVSFDWTLHEPPPPHQRLDRNGFLTWASKAALAGVRAADLVLVLLPGGLGTHTELGMALSLGKPVVIYAPRPELLEELNGDPPCLFYGMAKELTSDWADVEAFLKGYSGRAGVDR